MQRTIKSFVIRGGRISNRQQQALEQSLPHYELSLMNSPCDLKANFNRSAETIVEIGFGMGASLFTMAQEQPEINFIGIEVHRAGVGSLVADLHDEGLTNVRIVVDDAVTIFKEQFADNVLAGVQIFFPDPWHKKKHHKRRLIQPEFVKLVAQKIKVGGFIHCATDWQDYAEHIERVLTAESSLRGGYSERPASRPITKFEQRGQGLGHGVWDLMYVKQ